MSDRKPTIIVNRETPLAVETFSTIGNVVLLATSEITRESVKDADILIVRSDTKVDRQLIDGSAVGFVGTVTIGTDHIDEQYLSSKGIGFASAPGSNANAVAEYIAAALLVWAHRTGEPLRGRTCGIVGVGNVGKRVLKLAQALGMNVLLNDPPLARSTEDPAYRSLDELMEADIISVHVPLTMAGPDATYHLFDGERIAKMKRGSVLVNTARGAVVETRTLHNALKSRHLAGAVIDVWENEPAIDMELLGEVTLGTPHIAGYSSDGKLNALRMVYEQVCRYLDMFPSSVVGATSDSEPIIILESITNVEDILRFAVHQAYDIELDDGSLRKMQSMRESERSAFFMKLRSEYRLRNEFVHFSVKVSPNQIEGSNALRALGFRVEVKKEV